MDSLPIRLGTALKVTIAGTHAETTVVIGATRALLCSTTDCHIVLGPTPAATTSDTFLPAKTFLEIACLTTDMVSVIQDAAGGFLFINPGQ